MVHQGCCFLKRSESLRHWLPYVVLGKPFSPLFFPGECSSHLDGLVVSCPHPVSKHMTCRIVFPAFHKCTFFWTWLQVSACFTCCSPCWCFVQRLCASWTFVRKYSHFFIQYCQMTPAITIIAVTSAVFIRIFPVVGRFCVGCIRRVLCV